MTIGSFHGFEVTNRFRHGFYKLNIGRLVFPGFSFFTCQNLNPSYTEPISKNEPTLVPKLIVELFCCRRNSGSLFLIIRKMMRVCIKMRIEFGFYIGETLISCFYNQEQLFVFV